MMDYFKETHKECLSKVDTISGELKTLFTKMDISLDEAVEIIEKLKVQLPPILKVCFQ